jgi:serine/threonine protein kinase
MSQALPRRSPSDWQAQNNVSALEEVVLWDNRKQKSFLLGEVIHQTKDKKCTCRKIFPVDDAKTCSKFNVAKILLRKEHAQREHDLMNMMDHFNICKPVMPLMTCKSQPGSSPQVSAYYIITENVGRPLGHVIKPNTPFEVRYDALVQITSALAHIHERGIVHLDVKPFNVLAVPLVVDNVQQQAGPQFLKVTVIDFGASRKQGTIISHVIGTTNFMAPEMVALKPSPDAALSDIAEEKELAVHAAQDMWSLGKLICLMFTGSKKELAQDSEHAQGKWFVAATWCLQEIYLSATSRNHACWKM